MSQPPANLPIAPPRESVRPSDVPVFRELLEGHGVDTTELTDVDIARLAVELVELIALMHRIAQRSIR